MNKDLLTVEDVCKELGIGKNTAYGLIKDKKIKSAKIVMCFPRHLLVIYPVFSLKMTGIFEKMILIAL